MRNWDNWLRYQDNDRNPLHGCIQFMVKDGNTVAPIYDSEGTALANPQVTDTYGRTKYQVFIDTDVIAYFYKYIGEGIWSGQEDIDTSDISKWSLQYTSENTLDILANITSDTVVSIGTIEALRGVDVDGIPLVDGKKVITLLGYFNSGDKEPINYYWNAESTEQDNGGSVIASNNHITGRWIMVQPTEHVDSRHFGAFPSNSMNMQDQTYQIGNLFAYCSVHSLRPFFNGSTDYRWFKFTNLNVIADEIDISDGTRFMDLGNNTIQGNWNGDPFFNLSNTTVVAENVKASWMAKAYTGYKNVILDRISAQKNWQDANIDVRYSPCYGYNFNHCVISENGNIGSDNTNGVNNTFINCKLNERMFITSGDYTVSLVGLTSGCQIDMDDFRNNMWLYKQIRQTSDGDAFFDYRNFPNVGKPIDNYTGNMIQSESVWVTNLKNMMNSLYKLDTLNGQITTFYLENCIGYYEVPANTTVVMTNCTVKLKIHNNVSLSVTGGAVEFDNNWNDAWSLNMLTFLDTTVVGYTGVLYKGVTLSSRNSIINSQFDITGNAAYYNSVISQNQQCAYADVKDCNIGAEFLLYGITGDNITFPIHNDAGQEVATLVTTRYVNGTFKDNYVSGKIVLGAPNTNEHFVGNWLARGLSITNNTGLVANPIDINRGWSTLYEQYNIYTYTDNKGTFPGHHTMILNISDTSHWSTMGSGSGDVQLCYSGKVDGWPTWYDGATGRTDPNVYMTEFQMFSVGVYNVRFKATTSIGGTFYPPEITASEYQWHHPVNGTTTILDTIERTRQEWSAAQTATPFPKHLTWMNGMTWRITAWYGVITMLSLFGLLQYNGPLDIDFEVASTFPNKT